MDVVYAFQQTNLGEILLAYRGGKICFLGFVGDVREQILQEFLEQFPKACPVKNLAVLDLNRSLATKSSLADFSLTGTEFQRSVWNALLAIPPGTTMTYSQLAKALDKPQAARAVGRAAGSNPISVFIPCHRVIGASGVLTGYRWGLLAKQRLLACERAKNT